MRYLAVSLTALFVLAGCGGGGGGGSTYVPPPVLYANTASPYYLPLRSGNAWTFSSGGSIRDMGAITVNCTCAINGQAVEALELVDPDGTTVAGTFYFAKAASSHGSVLTLLIGDSAPGSTTAELISDGTTVGIPVMDDAATAGESWTLAGGTSTITSVGETQPYQGETIRNINTDTVSGDGSSFGFGFAQGVGFTSVSEGGGTITLTSFSIDAANSQAVRRAAAARTVRLSNAAGSSHAAALLRQIF